MSEIILVSACLAGINCRYDGKNNLEKEILQTVIEAKAIPVCPELFGGLDIPRDPCEIIIHTSGNKKIVSRDRKDYTKQFS